MANLTKSDILKLANLSKIKLSDSEVGEFKNELEQILDLVSKLTSVNTEGLDPTVQVTGLTNVFRPDEIIDYGVTPEELLKNVPSVEKNQIKVKRVLG